MQLLFGPAKSQTLSDPVLIDLYRYWNAQRRDRLYPARRDIDPCDIPHCLPNVLLVDVFDQPLRFRYRLVGTGVCALAGQSELTGKWVDEQTLGAYAQSVHALYASVVETRRPVRAFGQARQRRTGEWITLENLFMPLGDGDDRVTMVLVGAINSPTRLQIAESATPGRLHAAIDPIVA